MRAGRVHESCARPVAALRRGFWPSSGGLAVLSPGCSFRAFGAFQENLLGKVGPGRADLEHRCRFPKVKGKPALPVLADP